MRDWSAGRADQIAESVAGFAGDTHPDVVLLHVGTNDLLQGQSVSSTIDDIGHIIDNLRSVNPNITIYLAKIIPIAFKLDQTNELNDDIPGLVSEKDTSQSHVIVVDQFSGFNSDDSYDGVHPNESGEQKMAQRWFEALAPKLSEPPPPPPRQTEYLSDLSFRTVENGLGPVELNKSNGGAAAGDGRTQKLNNTLYRHGLGVHAGSDLRFDLNGQFKTFLTYAGVDDEVGNHAGSVIFRVYVDNAKVYDSGPVYGATGTKSIVIDVTAAQSLRLLVTDKGDGNASDHADWAEARVVRPPQASSKSFGIENIVIGTKKRDELLDDTDPNDDMILI